MKVTTFVLAVLAAPFAHTAPTELLGRQTKARQLIEPELFPVLQRYTKFAVASLATFVYGHGTCKSPPFKSRLVLTVSNTTTNTQFAVFQNDAAKEFIVSFPGSDSLMDAVTNINFPLIPLTSAPGHYGCQVNEGVLLSWRSVQGQLITALAELRSQHYDYSTIAANNVPIKAAYTMGSLRVGNQQYADFTNNLSGASDTQIDNFIRITHSIDGVPVLPPNSIGFEHTRTEIYELENAALTQTAATT
ncbi:alpha/beta-hydrolase [Clathrospora elynae]|uniref:Alpha/beta-hydrolase n=1 Tax=Clathrospora elynae TaxID=706981 RepID=A0A6A5SL70_9PLEO|nr:alpha/beta-hydrolase [Clathrospora elynae]